MPSNSTGREMCIRDRLKRVRQGATLQENKDIKGQIRKRSEMSIRDRPMTEAELMLRRGSMV